MMSSRSASSVFSAAAPAVGQAEDRLVAAGSDGASSAPLRIRLHKPIDEAGENSGARPLVLHFHAGAFMAGSLDDAFVATLLAEAGAVAVSLDYPLAPNHPFPQAIEAGYRALCWMQEQRQSLSGAMAPLFVAGEEAGGNLAAAVALMARDRQGPELAGQILVSPMLDVCTGSASQRRAQASESECPWVAGWQRYLPHPPDALHPYATPGAGMRLSGVPETLLVSAQDDPLRDETLVYARRLREIGVGVQTLVLAESTRWPFSFLETRSSPDTPLWANAVREQLRQFLCRCRV